MCSSSPSDDDDDAKLEGVLMRYAEWYAARYVPSAQRLKERVMRRCAKALSEGHQSENPARIVGQVCNAMQERGFIADGALAGGVATSLLQRGKSRRAIRDALMRKGVPRDAIDLALEAVSPDAEREAALSYAQRRRLGAYRPTPPDRAQFAKDLQKMIRNGFPFDTARAALEAEVEDAE